MWPHSKAATPPGTAAAKQFNPSPDPAVLHAFGWQPQRLTITLAPAGFSGATVWKIDTSQGSFALKRWPHGQSAGMTLSSIHQRMQEATQAGLTFIPIIRRATANESIVNQAGQQWDALSWMPGAPLSAPNTEQLIAAIRCLAQLHAVWRTQPPVRTSACPAIEMYHQRLAEWTTLELHQLRQCSSQHPDYPLAIELFFRFREPALSQLTQALHTSVIIQPCLADIHADHVLYSGNTVTGIIDYGCLRYDHPAQDLARLLGSYDSMPPALIAVALKAYPSSDTFLPLLKLLLDTGPIVTLSNWLRWLILEQRTFPNQQAVYSRLAKVINRIGAQN